VVWQVVRRRRQVVEVCVATSCGCHMLDGDAIGALFTCFEPAGAW